MEWSAGLGEMVREDAMTSVNLATINKKAPKDTIYIVSHQGAKQEAMSGADWLWAANGVYWTVQAKRLDVVPSSRWLQYTINRSQFDSLFSFAKAAVSSYKVPYKPAYVFYNSMTDLFGLPPESAGCMYVQAENLNPYMTSSAENVTITPDQLISVGVQPWWKMFGS